MTCPLQSDLCPVEARYQHSVGPSLRGEVAVCGILPEFIQTDFVYFTATVGKDPSAFRVARQDIFGSDASAVLLTTGLPLTRKYCICLKIEGVNHTQPLVSPVFCEKPVCNPGKKFEGRCFRRDCVRCGWERKWHHGISFRKLRVREEAGD